jgi:hypothetical protein
LSEGVSHHRRPLPDNFLRPPRLHPELVLFTATTAPRQGDHERTKERKREKTEGGTPCDCTKRCSPLALNSLNSLESCQMGDFLYFLQAIEGARKKSGCKAVASKSLSVREIGRMVPYNPLEGKVVSWCQQRGLVRKIVGAQHRAPTKFCVREPRPQVTPGRRDLRLLTRKSGQSASVR